MVHMWVNTVTGCGLPRKEINGLRFGPPVDRPPGSSVLVRSRASTRHTYAFTVHRAHRSGVGYGIYVYVYKVCTYTYTYRLARARSCTRSSPKAWLCG